VQPHARHGAAIGVTERVDAGAPIPMSAGSPAGSPGRPLRYRPGIATCCKDRGMPADIRSTTWLVTGASRGFGRELAEQLPARGHRVAATLRRPGLLSAS
jgi:hypothetical protein